jgi:hypothetical protein
MTQIVTPIEAEESSTTMKSLSPVQQQPQIIIQTTQPIQSSKQTSKKQLAHLERARATKKVKELEIKSGMSELEQRVQVLEDKSNDLDNNEILTDIENNNNQKRKRTFEKIDNGESAEFPIAIEQPVLLSKVPKYSHSKQSNVNRQASIDSNNEVFNEKFLLFCMSSLGAAGGMLVGYKACEGGWLQRTRDMLGFGDGEIIFRQ